MTVSPFQLEVPDTLLAKLRERASESRRTVEEEAVSILEDATYDSTGDDLEGLTLLDDDALFAIIRSPTPAGQSDEFETLIHRRRLESLTPEEEDRLEFLTSRCEWKMLSIAKAAAILHQRGRDVSFLFKS